VLQRLDRFLGRWTYRVLGLFVALLGAAAARAGYQIVVVEGRWPGLLLLLPGGAAAVYGIRLIWTAGRRRLSDAEF
jgi:hypothetical protein